MVSCVMPKCERCRREDASSSIFHCVKDWLRCLQDIVYDEPYPKKKHDRCNARAFGLTHSTQVGKCISL